MTRLWEYLDGELEAKEARGLRGHLTECPACRPAYHCDRAFLALLTRCSRRHPGATSAFRHLIRWNLGLAR